MKKNKILITGGNGFIGKTLVKVLAKKYDVFVYDISEKHDILDEMKLNEAISNVDIVIHLAGLLGTHELVDNVKQAVRVNIEGSINVLDNCSQYGTKLIIFSKPNVWLNTYSITKDTVEQFTKMYIKEHRLKAVIVKPFNVYGPYQPIESEIGYRKAIPTWLTSDTIEVYGTGEQTMDLIHVLDVSKAVNKILKKFDACVGKTFEIGSGEEVTCNEITKTISEWTGAEIKHIPMRKGETINTKLCADIENLKKIGWKPVIKHKEGLKHTYDWYEKTYNNSNHT